MNNTDGELLDQLYQRPGFLLRRAHQLSVGIFEAECRAIGLTPPQYGVLVVLFNADGIDQSTVSRALGFDRVTTLRIVRGLEARGLLQREASAVHARRLALVLTAKGKKLLAGATGPARHASDRLLQPLDADEQRTLIGLLRKLCTGLEPVARAQIVRPTPERLAPSAAVPAVEGFPAVAGPVRPL